MTQSGQHYPEPTVGALIFDPAGRLFLMRSHKWAGKYVVPGGHVELGESLEDALCREVEEETGLAISDITFLGVQEFVYDPAFWKSRHFLFFDFACRTEGTEVRLNDEAEEYAWVSVDEALRMPIEPYTERAIRAHLAQKAGGPLDRSLMPDAAQPAPATGGAHRPAVQARYVHTNLIARDWRALARFYETVFGCVPVPPERDLAGPPLESGTGIPGAHLRGVHLRLPGYGDAGPTLEIFTYDDHPEKPATAVNRPGFGHVAFSVSDVAAARTAVLAAGGRSVGEVVTTGVAGGGQITWCYVTDPEGNVIELQEAH
ncbi:MAG: NUDIX domain-containing protein [Anaerolineae bacterium]|nr:NUDIX domain-containing protein [Anaerolineae bacterium]